MVYSGGGISPDYKVTIDTSFNTRFLTHVAASGLLNKAAYQYVDANRNNLNNYKSVENFITKFEVSNELINQLITMAQNDKITQPTEADMARSGAFIKQQLKALIARQIWRDGGYFKVISMKDKTIQKAILELGK